jgi:ferredoxin
MCATSQQLGDWHHRLHGRDICTLGLAEGPPDCRNEGWQQNTKLEIAIMAYIITDTCTKDELCVEACPTDCIHPKKDDEKFEAATQLYVDPEGCIDCGACVPVCPTNSIFIVDEVPADKQEFIEKNAAYYA